MGEDYGDSPSVGYELLHCQVTRAQGMFSPRSHHIHFSLEYVAENLEAPTVVLQYPSQAELIRELKKGYDYVGISFVLPTFHRLKEAVAIIRKYAPKAEIILGGYGTVIPDEQLKPFGDHICREEGVGFMRRLLGESELPLPHRHPMIVNPLRVFGKKISQTGIVFGGLGCPNACDFCCTSHFFKRKHIKLLPTGADIYRVIRRYMDIDPNMAILVIDEDFLLNKKRAMEFRDCVLEGGVPLGIFVFASIRALSQYTVTEILEMGIDGMWIGYEGTRSGYAKQKGRTAAEIFTEFRDHGISILASMILGFPYQTPEIIEEELSGLMAIHPDLTQFLIYGPPPGTPFFDKVMKENLLRDEYVKDPDLFYKRGSGFFSLVKHATMTPEQIEAEQRRCFDEDFKRLGPSIYRAVETWFKGYMKLKDSPNPYLRAKARMFARDLRKAYPVFLPGRVLGPTKAVRKHIGELQRQIIAELGKPNLWESFQSVAAIGAAAWTGLKLKLGIFQHVPLIRHEWRMGGKVRPYSAAPSHAPEVVGAPR